MTYGVEVSDALKESVKKYLQQFVGSERVFPTQNGAPRIMTMTEFLILKQTLSFRAVDKPSTKTQGQQRHSVKEVNSFPSPIRVGIDPFLRNTRR